MLRQARPIYLRVTSVVGKSTCITRRCPGGSARAAIAPRMYEKKTTVNDSAKGPCQLPLLIYARRMVKTLGEGKPEICRRASVERGYIFSRSWREEREKSRPINKTAAKSFRRRASSRRARERAALISSKKTKASHD